MGKSHGDRNTKIHVMALDERTALAISPSAGQAHDGVEGRKLLARLESTQEPCHLVMDRAYEGDETRQLAWGLGYIPTVPPRRHRKIQWDYSVELYGERNIVERLIRRFKGFRRVFTRYDKLDIMYPGYATLACIFEAFIRQLSVNRP